MNKKTVGQALRTLAFVGAIAVVGTWFSFGANTGWTKTSVPVTAVDEVTGIESQTWEDKFVPGLEFLGAGLIGAVVLGGVSFFFRKS